MLRELDDRVPEDDLDDDLLFTDFVEDPEELPLRTARDEELLLDEPLLTVVLLEPELFDRVPTRVLDLPEVLLGTLIVVPLFPTALLPELLVRTEERPLVTPDVLLLLPRVLRTTPDLLVFDLVLPTVEPLFPDVRVLPVVLTVPDPLLVPERVLLTVLPVERPVFEPLVLPVYREPVEFPVLDLLVITEPPFLPVRVIAEFPEFPLPDRVLVPSVIALFPFPLL